MCIYIKTVIDMVGQTKLNRLHNIMEHGEIDNIFTWGGGGKLDVWRHRAEC